MKREELSEKSPRFKVTFNKKDGGKSVVAHLDPIGLLDTVGEKLKKLVNGEITSFTAEEM